MMNSVYTAASGLSSQQKRLDIIADNIANVNTAGYKSRRMDFKDAVYTAMVDASNPGSTENLARGHGALVARVARNESDGNIQTTPNNLDFSIEGEGYFALAAPSGETYYTRCGAFYLSPSPEGSYLVNSSGYYVLDAQGERIIVPDNANVGEDGTVRSAEGENTGIRIGVYTFANKAGLSSVGGTSFTATEASGEALTSEGYTLTQYSLESSNVDLAQELTMMLRTQRAFSLASRALQTADSMDGLVNNMRR